VGKKLLLQHLGGGAVLDTKEPVGYDHAREETLALQVPGEHESAERLADVLRARARDDQLQTICQKGITGPCRVLQSEKTVLVGLHRQPDNAQGKRHQLLSFLVRTL